MNFDVSVGLLKVMLPLLKKPAKDITWMAKECPYLPALMAMIYNQLFSWFLTDGTSPALSHTHGFIAI
ncbi:hypothetical protein UFOVP730_38 [uncultured Caudovirales phage]|uniref:Uncharacterized protein n=1 Tax=uncultured Caudovirales phage TaxID=2100421 RepID=A0A6J5NN69_9CAUD|nr:hypothetical protein UFOVP730_38 [uncultured Caudovirales phage]